MPCVADDFRTVEGRNRRGRKSGWPVPSPAVNCSPNHHALGPNNVIALALDLQRN